jgi:hypothetical protein
VAKITIAKAVTHVHSEWSYDAAWSLSKIARFFEKVGFRIVLTAEHNCTFNNKRWDEYRIACHKASTDRILIIPGLEYSDNTNTIHVLTWGTLPFLGKNQTINTLLQKVNEMNGICVLAHPSRRNAWQYIDASWLPLLHGIELWNRKFDGLAASREAISLLKANCRLLPFVGLDFHRANQLFPLSMMIRINGTLSEDNVINAFHNRQYHSLAFGIPVIWFRNRILAFFTRTVERIRCFISRKLAINFMNKQ